MKVTLITVCFNSAATLSTAIDSVLSQKGVDIEYIIVDGGSKDGTVEILKAAQAHKGTAVCEILQNCVIFNDGCHDAVYKKEERQRNAIYVRHGEKLTFGPANEFGLVQEGFGLKVVTIGEDGYTLDDVLTHDAHCQDNTLQLKLAMMSPEDGFPIALGVIRDVEAPTYEAAVHAQLEEVSAQKKYHNFAELLETNDTWEVV